VLLLLRWLLPAERSQPVASIASTRGKRRTKEVETSAAAVAASAASQVTATASTTGHPGAPTSGQIDQRCRDLCRGGVRAKEAGQGALDGPSNDPCALLAAHKRARRAAAHRSRRTAHVASRQSAAAWAPEHASEPAAAAASLCCSHATIRPCERRVAAEALRFN
jgi:hypothetical protein